MIKTVSAKEARSSFAEILGRVGYGGDVIIVEKQKKPMVAIIPADQLPDLLQLQRQRFAAVDAIRETLPDLSDDEIQKDIAEALKAVRASHD